MKPTSIFGNFYEVFVFKKSMGYLLWGIYDQFQTPYFGMFILDKPHLVVKDPDIIKNILVKDFNHFYDRNILSDEKCDQLSSKMLFIAKNPEWKFMRSKMTPIFSSGKIKSMIVLMNEAASEMKQYINKHLADNSIEVKEMCAKYSTDVITSCAFGLNAQSFHDNEAQFRQIGRKMFDFHWKTATRQMCYFLAPSIVKLFRMSFFDPSVNSFLRDVFWRTIRSRENSTFKRNDLIDIINQIKKQASLDDSIKFEGDRVVAQAAQFFAAGFETVSASLSFTLYEVCLQPEIQKRLQSEIRSTKKEHGELTYEVLQSMKYLNMVVSETLRKYPVLPFLDRKCMENYKIPNTNFVIEKGTPVFISMFGLHYDKKYYPDPHKYDPERFSDENKNKIPNFAYMPFGEGPRNCIGERFGLLVTKLGVAHILSEFELEKTADTPIPIQFSTKGFLLAPLHGLHMKFRKISAS